MEEKLKKIFSDTIDILTKNKEVATKIQSVVINEDFFKDEFTIGFEKQIKSEYLKEQLRKISSENKPTLYWFEFDDKLTSKEILRSKYVEYKNRLGNQYHIPEYRYTSSFKKNFDEVTNVLYVGKVEKGFYGRVITHLGYATSPKTAGMQLHHWFAEDMQSYGNLTLNFIQFSDDMIYLIALFEKLFAKELKPLIGRY